VVFPFLETFSELLLEISLPWLSACAFPNTFGVLFGHVATGETWRVFLVISVDSATYRVDSVDMFEYSGIVFGLSVQRVGKEFVVDILPNVFCPFNFLYKVFLQGVQF